MSEELVTSREPARLRRLGSLAAMLDRFLKSALDSDNTRRAYARHIREAFQVMELSDLDQVDQEHLMDYREWLLGDGRGVATHAQALYALRSFLSWCAATQGLFLPFQVAGKLLRVPKVYVQRPYVILTQGEVNRLLEAAGNLRDRAFILVMVGGGLRVAEVEALECSDLVTIDGEAALYVRHGKGGKDRTVPVREEVSDAIHAYLVLTHRCIGDATPLFLAEDNGVISRDSSRLSDDGMRKVLRAIVVKAGLALRVSPHALRHTFGMEYQRQGGDLNKTASVLGHSTLKPTLRYVDHLRLAELRVALPKWIRARLVPES